MQPLLLQSAPVRIIRLLHQKVSRLDDDDESVLLGFENPRSLRTKH